MGAPRRAAAIEGSVGAFGGSPLHLFDAKIVLPVVHMVHVKQEVRQLGTFSNDYGRHDAPLRSLGAMYLMGMLAAIHALCRLAWLVAAKKGTLHLRPHVVLAANTAANAQTLPFEREKEFRGGCEVLHRQPRYKFFSEIHVHFVVVIAFGSGQSSVTWGWHRPASSSYELETVELLQLRIAVGSIVQGLLHWLR